MGIIRGRLCPFEPTRSEYNLQRVNPVAAKGSAISATVYRKARFLSCIWTLANNCQNRFYPMLDWSRYSVSWILQWKALFWQRNWRRVLEGLNLNWFFYSSSLRKWDLCNEIVCVCLPIPFSSHPPNNFGTDWPITTEFDRGRRSQRYQIPVSLMKAGSQAEETALIMCPGKKGQETCLGKASSWLWKRLSLNLISQTSEKEHPEDPTL